MSGIGTSCDMGMRSGQEWIIYGQKSNNQYLTSYCSNSIQVNKGFTEYESDAPFFLSNIYALREYFHHSLQLPTDGVHETHFKDGRIKSRYKIYKNQIQGEYLYVDNTGKISSYNFVDGQLQGQAFRVNGKSFQLLKYDKGALIESAQYIIADSISLRDFELYKRLPDSVNAISKTIYYRETYLPDGSKQVTVWNMSRNIRSIANYDKNGNDNFSIRYFDSGNVEGYEIYNENTGIRTRKDYYPNGILQTEWITYKDGTRTIRHFKPDGTPKE